MATTILLDLEGTSLLYDSNGVCYVHPKLWKLLRNYDVTLYSSRIDIDRFAEAWGVSFVRKGDYSFPAADVLIDDIFENQENVTVRLYFPSIDTFLNFARKERKMSRKSIVEILVRFVKDFSKKFKRICRFWKDGVRGTARVKHDWRIQAPAKWKC